MEKARYSKNQSGEISRHKYYHEHIIQYVLLAISFVVAVTVLFQVKDFVWKLVIVTLIVAHSFKPVDFRRKFRICQINLSEKRK